MARNLNRAQLIGHLGGDPNIYKGEAGLIVNISVATTYSYKNSTTGEKIDKTEWHKVVFFGKLAEIAQQYLHKGDKILVEGPLRTRKWTDKENIERYTTEIMANNLEMLGSPSGKSVNREEVNPYQTIIPDNSDADDKSSSIYSTPFQQDDDIPF